MNDMRNNLSAVLRQDLVSFIIQTYLTVGGGSPYLHNWPVEAIADYLVQAFARDIKRLIITMPPRSLKSICASVAFPAWVLGHEPETRFICASYSAEIAAYLGLQCRNVIMEPWYKRTFPKTRLDRSKSAADDFQTTAKGGRLATSTGGTLTGRGGNFIIIDDPIKPQDAMSDAMRDAVNRWYHNTLVSRLDNKRDDVIIIVTQRVHPDDLVGYVLDKDDWVHLNLPAIAESEQKIEFSNGRVITRQMGDVLHPAREPLEVLEKIRSGMSSFDYQAQFQQAPVAPGGNMINWAWFKTYSFLPEDRPFGRIIQSWDTANKDSELSDYSVCTTWLVIGEDYYLIDVFRERLDFPELYKAAIKLRAKHQADTILIEDAGSGTQLIQSLRRVGCHVIPIKPQGNKVTRLNVRMDKIEAGHVHLPEEAPWLDDFKAEIMAFPKGKHDDQVDSLSQFLNWICKPRGLTANYAMPY